MSSQGLTPHFAFGARSLSKITFKDSVSMTTNRQSTPLEKRIFVYSATHTRTHSVAKLKFCDRKLAVDIVTTSTRKSTALVPRASQVVTHKDASLSQPFYL
ncbi:hypothetical protein L798_15492 [Zootermopsis nevadensis]|uniref:Uncharacterized protein n=1 Tax=Zootermopsis nevadensis TaxID=136037 RepID=A0A067QMM6_ZOONE|nr:hypothetical protein L798_15492 [Zootermopsis nevadensis]